MIYLCNVRSLSVCVLTRDCNWNQHIRRSGSETIPNKFLSPEVSLFEMLCLR